MYYTFVNRLAVEKALGIGGWMSEVELSWLSDMAEKRMAIVELGSFRGRSTKALAMSTPGTIYAIDHFGSGPTNGLDIPPDLHEAFMSNLWSEIVRGRVVTMRMDTIRAASLLSSVGFMADMVFIDADHQYESVSKEIDAYLPLVSKGGVISGHDYSAGWPGVVKAVDERFPNRKTVDAIWYHSV